MVVSFSRYIEYPVYDSWRVLIVRKIPETQPLHTESVQHTSNNPLIGY